MNVESDIKETIKVLKKLRKFKSQEDVAKHLGYNASYFSRVFKYGIPMDLEDKFFKEFPREIYLKNSNQSTADKVGEVQEPRAKYKSNIVVGSNDDYMMAQYADLSAVAGELGFENPATLPKNKLEKIKIIPSILIPDLQKLDKKSPNDFIFQTNDKNIESSEVSRRTYFGKEFLKIKKELKLGPEYTMYSFRHTFITKLYRELRKESTVLETFDRLMLITGHSTLKALKSYLRDLDVEIPEDYSHLL